MTLHRHLDYKSFNRNQTRYKHEEEPDNWRYIINASRRKMKEPLSLEMEHLSLPPSLSLNCIYN